MHSTAIKNKHLKLDQKKMFIFNRYFNVETEQEAIDRALSLLMEEEQIIKAIKPLKGVLKGDKRKWPYL